MRFTFRRDSAGEIAASQRYQEFDASSIEEAVEKAAKFGPGELLVPAFPIVGEKQLHPHEGRSREVWDDRDMAWK